MATDEPETPEDKGTDKPDVAPLSGGANQGPHLATPFSRGCFTVSVSPLKPGVYTFVNTCGQCMIIKIQFSDGSQRDVRVEAHNTADVYKIEPIGYTYLGEWPCP
jgi:hypothetical protein